MRVEVSANGRHLSPMLREYAETRAWRAVQRWAPRVSWVGVQLSWHQDPFSKLCVRCQIDVLLRGSGRMVTVRHTDGSPYVGIDCAAVRLSQAMKRRLGHAGDRTPARQPVDAGRASSPSSQSSRSAPSPQPRLAIVIRPTGRWPRLRLARWLRTRYGIEQVQNLVLSSTSWRYLAGADPVPHEYIQGLRDRLTLAELCRPELIVVLGIPSSRTRGISDEDGHRAVERLIQRIVAMGVSSEIIGVWLDHEPGDGDPSATPPQRDTRHSGKAPANAEIAVLSGNFDTWLAERLWEDDGGAFQSPDPHRRQRHVERTSQIRAPGMDAPTRPWSGKSPEDRSGRRPDPAQIAARH